MVRTRDGLSGDTEVIVEEWRTAFEGLYNGPNIEHDRILYANAMSYLEIQSSDRPSGECEHVTINGNITYNETITVIRRLKSKTSTGVDFIPNEIIKCPGIHFALYKLFSVIFETGLMPTTWLRAIISPIPKGSAKDPYTPMNYRGISLLWCVGKTYTSLLNERIIKYCDENNILVDEQNGFRKDRSCSDHLFTLTSIIRNRLSQRQHTFCAFIDMEKAFDYLDRNMLFYRLSLYKIEGKMYNSIRSLFHNTSSCVCPS